MPAVLLRPDQWLAYTEYAKSVQPVVSPTPMPVLTALNSRPPNPRAQAALTQERQLQYALVRVGLEHATRPTTGTPAVLQRAMNAATRIDIDLAAQEDADAVYAEQVRVFLVVGLNRVAHVGLNCNVL